MSGHERDEMPELLLASIGRTKPQYYCRLCLWVCALLLCVSSGFFSSSLFAEPTAAVNEAVSEPIEFIAHDFRGKEIRLDDFRGSRFVVIAFLGAECPVARLYAGRLQELAQKFPVSEVAIIGVNSNAQDRLAKIERFVRDHAITFPVIKDAGNRLADLLHAERTPQVFLLDENRHVRYQGRIDDQYQIGVIRQEPQREDLQMALDELRQGQPVSVPRTEPVGCLIGRIKAPDQSSPVTYSKHIAPIFQDHCVQCHRPGEVAPFTLTSYDDVAGWGPMIAEVVHNRRMPPWHADSHFGTFQNDPSLTETERTLIADWVQHGCPEGNPADLPSPRQFTSGWQLSREPDMVIAMGDKPFEIPAQAGPEGVRYQHFWVPSGLSEDRWLQGMEVRPGNRAVVHHVIVYATREKGRTNGDSFLAAFVPGLRLHPLPVGAAKKLPANSWLHFEVHYTPNGAPQQDLTVLGLNFADPKLVTHEVRTTVVGKQDFVIQPQLAGQKFTARSKKSPPVDLISLSPHMHLRGESFEYEVEYPDGTREVLLKVPRYDFNWQTRYQLKEPKAIPAGAIIHCTATFDNSSRNLANPDPTATVRWGDQSWDEMFLGYMDIMFPVNAAMGSVKVPKVSVKSIMQNLDKNQDGVISREEAVASPLMQQYFPRLDIDQDGILSADELQQGLDRAANLQ